MTPEDSGRGVLPRAEPRRRKTKNRNCLRISDDDCVDLLNFRLPVLNTRDRRQHRFARATTAATSSPFDRDQYLRAVFQFVVPKGVTQLDWSKVIEVYLFDSQCVLCPICLTAPAAGRITRCGHIFCLPCVLQYFSGVEKDLAVCPICSKYLTIADLRSLHHFRLREYAVNEVIDMSLMKRCRETGTVEPVDPDRGSVVIVPLNGPLIEIKDLDAFKTGQRRRERLELEFRLQSDLADDETLSVDFDRLALEDLDKSYDDNSSSSSSDNQEQPALSANDVRSSNDDRSYSYLYQSADGQRIYLHPLSVKCLLSEYKSFNTCPWHLRSRIVSLESKFLTAEARRMYKYLGHLPDGTEFKLVELDLQGIVSDSTLSLFAERINSRRIRELQISERDKVNSQRREAREGEKLMSALRRSSPSPTRTAVPTIESFPVVSECQTQRGVSPWPCTFAQIAVNERTTVPVEQNEEEGTDMNMLSSFCLQAIENSNRSSGCSDLRKGRSSRRRKANKQQC